MYGGGVTPREKGVKYLVVSEVPGLGRDVDDGPGEGTGRGGGRGFWGGDR